MGIVCGIVRVVGEDDVGLGAEVSGDDRRNDRRVAGGVGHGRKDRDCARAELEVRNKERLWLLRPREGGSYRLCRTVNAKYKSQQGKL